METICGEHFPPGAAFEASLAASDVPPSASITAEAVSNNEEPGSVRIVMTMQNIHAACNYNIESSRGWRDTGKLETFKPMASKAESPESTVEIARRLRLTREAFHMKKAEWCRWVEISAAAWNNIEGSKYSPPLNRISIDLALSVCRKTGVGLDWIYRGIRNSLPLNLALEIQKLEAAEQNPPAPKRKRTG